MFHGFSRNLSCRLKLAFPRRRPFSVLAIESSADDTCAAIVDSSRKILANVVMKQHDIHEEYGGIYPMSAIGTHQSNMPYAVRQALDDAGFDVVRDVDGIAFTRGPGMPGCLSVGMNAAKSLAAALNKPLVGVHHMQGHALTPLLTAWPQEPQFPFLSLLISGGHTLLLLAKSVRSFEILATTRDESIGRSFDKVSKLLELKWTSLGPGDALEKFCAEEDEDDCPTVPPFPRPLIGQPAFSFSAFHSHVNLLLNELETKANFDQPMKKAIARAFQSAAVGHLEEKVILGLELCKQKGIFVQDVVVSGGVASNQYLRHRLRQCLLNFDPGTPYSLIFPPPHLCTDNAVMIAWASMHRFLANDTDLYSIELRPKWSIEDL
ncbi:Gcp-like domain-containing protein [Gymnopilus junonius]|uniref:N(6)-L-threonylcarbamoyladenine synthase n=1 Tax=Gymnopilus junonius TaxID=109634 RepID=A0A9P5NL51_GYMJU|nr:Gcp-like domain-containing protein [Gymnopilus junonius]